MYINPSFHFFFRSFTNLTHLLLFHILSSLTGKVLYTKTPTSDSATIKPKQTKKCVASILSPLCKIFGLYLLLGNIFELIQVLLTFVSPLLLRKIINFIDSSTVKGVDSSNGTLSTTYAINSDQDPLWHGIFYAILLFVLANTETLFTSQYSQRILLAGLRVHTTLVGAIYRKALCLSNAARKEMTVGEIVNLMFIDADRILNLFPYISELWSAPLRIGLSMYFLWDLLGVSVFAGKLLCFS